MTELDRIFLREFRVHLENIILRLLIGERWKDGENDSQLTSFPHTHACAELFVCGAGCVRLKTEEGILPLYAGDAAIVPPGIYHKKDGTTEGTEGYALSFLCFQRHMKDCGNLYETFRPFLEGKRILVWRNQNVLIESVRQIVAEAETARDFTPALLLAQLLLKAAELPLDTTEADPAAEQNAAPRFDDMQRIMQLEHSVENSYMQEWKTEEIAEHLHISSRQLDRIVKKRFGKTLHEVIMDKRVQIAQRLLLTTDDTVDKIAVAVGFRTSAGLYREFSRRLGTTPGAYRKDFQKTE